MKKYLKLGVVALLAGTIAIAGSARVYLWHSYHSERMQGAQLAAQIEGFEISHGKLPGSLEQIGVAKTDEGRGPFYLRESDHQYKIWFGDTLGRSYIFDSVTRKWQFEG